MKRAEIIYNHVVERTRPVSDVDRLNQSLQELPLPVVEPVLVLVSGLPGTGKSFFSRRLAERLPAVILESDALRRVLVSQPGHSQAESTRLFKAIHRITERLLRMGSCIIVDATNLTERQRCYFYGIAGRLDVKLIVVSLQAPPLVVKERLAARSGSPGGSNEADWQVYLKMKPSVEKITRRHYAVDTSADITPVIDRIVAETGCR